MKLFGLLRKPAWEHKDPAIRARALQTSHEPALLARIAEFAQSDPDPQVRAAALRRVDDAGLLERRLRGELDAMVAGVARERLGERLCQTTMDIASAQAVLLHVHDAEVLTRVAERSPHPQLRRTALERIERPGFHLQRCLQDPDADIRQWLLQRFDSIDVLQKIADGARKTDKRLTRAARERIDELRLALGDEDTLRRRVLALCEQLGRLARELPADRDATLVAFAQEWQSLRPRVGAALQVRGDGALAMTDAAVRAARGEPVARKPSVQDDNAAEVAAAPAEAAAAVAEEAQPDPALEALFDELPAADAADFDVAADALWRRASQHPDSDNAAVQAQLVRLRGELDARRQRRAARHAEQQREAEESARRQLDGLEAAIQSGNLGAVREAHAAIDAISLPRNLRKRWQAAEAELAKLERWQRWSGNQARLRLCEDAEALAGSGVHPDALVSRIKELQTEWARLDALEPATTNEGGLARRFRAVCHRALAPARPYFEKRRELRGERAEQIEKLLADTAEAAATPALRQQLREAMADLDGVAPEKRQALGRRLRDRLSALDGELAGQREQAELGKRKLIARLRRDLGAADAAAAVALAKAAQAEWKTLPRGARASEDALWKELRELVDPLFDRQREQADAVREQQQAQQAQAEQVLAELQALATDPERLLHADATLEQLQTRWRELLKESETPSSDERGGGRRERGPRPPRVQNPLEARFESARQAVLDARKSALAAREREQWQRICTAGELLDRMAASDPVQRATLGQAYAELDLPADARTALQARHDAIGDANTRTSTEDVESARRLAVRAELASGLESPPDDASLRRSEQMQRLAAKLEGRDAQGNEVLRGLLIELQSLSGIDADQRQAAQQRILAALAAGTPRRG